MEEKFKVYGRLGAPVVIFRCLVLPSGNNSQFDPGRAWKMSETIKTRP